MNKFSDKSFLLMIFVLFLFSCATMESRWESAQKEDTVGAYQAFIKDYPDTILVEKARLKLKDKRFAYIEKKFDLARKDFLEKKYNKWIKYSNYDHLISTCNRFIKDYPETAQSEKAQVILSETQQMKAEHIAHNRSFEIEDRWVQAVSKNNVEAYQAFLNNYPDGELSEQARQKLSVRATVKGILLDDVTRTPLAQTHVFLIEDFKPDFKYLVLITENKNISVLCLDKYGINYESKSIRADTDSLGQFVFENVPIGIYLIALINSNSLGKKKLVQCNDLGNPAAPAGDYFIRIYNNQTINLGKIMFIEH